MATNGFRRILVATDGSAAANAAMDCTASLARSSGALVRVVHVWNLEIRHRHSPSDSAVRVEAEHLIAGAVDRLRLSGVQVGGQLAHADSRHVGGAIAEVARQFRPDLFVVGSRAFSDWQSIGDHSVGDGPRTGPDCPLLIVRARPAGYDGGPMRILLAIARRDDAVPGFTTASAVAATAGSRALVINVAWSVTTEHGVPSPDPTDMMQAISDSAVAALFASGIHAESWPLHPGPVASVVAEAACRWQADIIVLGSSRMGDLGSMLFGSVTHEILLNSDQPVLIAERA